MKTSITFSFDSMVDGSDDPRNYIDPVAPLIVISEITRYLRELDKYGLGDRDIAKLKPESIVQTIRERVLEMCADIPQEWKQ